MGNDGGGTEDRGYKGSYASGEKVGKMGTLGRRTAYLNKQRNIRDKVRGTTIGLDVQHERRRSATGS